jgi:hypothetical protein
LTLSAGIEPHVRAHTNTRRRELSDKDIIEKCEKYWTEACTLYPGRLHLPESNFSHHPVKQVLMIVPAFMQDVFETRKMLTVDWANVSAEYRPMCRKNAD